MEQAFRGWKHDENLKYGEDPRHMLDVFHPAGCGVGANGAEPARPVILFFHGGGFTSGDQSWIPENFKLLGLVIISATYRLAPAAKFPDYIDDGARAARWAKENAARFGGDPERIYIAGHSAGAYIAASLATMPEHLGVYGLRPGHFAGYIPISASMVTHFAVAKGRHGVDGATVVDGDSPINRATGETPPMLILCGQTGLDIAGRPADNRLMYEILKAKGAAGAQFHEISGMDHVSVGDAAALYIARFVR